MYLTVAQYNESIALIRTKLVVDRGEAWVAALPPGFLSNLLAFIMSILPMLGCLVPAPGPTPTPTPAQVKQQDAANGGYTDIQAARWMGGHEWRNYGRHVMPSMHALLASRPDDDPLLTGLIAAATDPNG